MMKHSMRIPVSIVLLLFLFHMSFAQTDIALGEWKEHFPYNVGNWVTQSENYIYYAAPVSLVALNKEDLSPTYYSKIDGLNDVRPKIVNYHSGLDILFIVYENSNIDLMTSEGIFNANDIQIKDNILGSKQINIVRFEGKKAFLPTDFGLVSFDLEQRVFGFTCFTDFPVYDFASWNGRYYMATENGIYSAPEQAGFNYAFLGNWTLEQETNGWPTQYFSKALCVWNEALYADVNDSLYRFDGNEAKSVYGHTGYGIQFLQPGEGQLLVGWNCLSGCNADDVMFYKNPSDVAFSGSGCVNQIEFAIQEMGSERIFYADRYRNFRRAGEAGADCTLFTYKGPKNEKVFDIAIHPDGSIWVSSGSVTSGYGYTFTKDGVYVLEDGDWGGYDQYNTPALIEPELVQDFLQFAIHPMTGTVYCSTYLSGLIEFGEEVKVYTQDNSCIEGTLGDESRERVPDIAFDEQGTLWMSNYLSPHPITALTKEGECYNFTVPGENRLTRLTIDEQGYKWYAIFGSGTGIVLFDEGEDLANTGDDRMRIFTSSNSMLPSDYVNCIVTDLDGAVWAGTRDGAVVFECGSVAFDETICQQGNRPIVEQNGILSYLLEGENVLAIAVDGANRKWFGTENGIFVQSPSGEQEVMRFTAENSPLPDNHIRTIEIHPETGEVFIGTESGIVVYRSDATVGTTQHGPDVYAFPNPVRPDYNGPIAIKGLPRDATVKITDVNGQLVHQTEAEGGQATWNGRDYTGRKAASGVYFVFSSSESLFGSKPDVMVTKILFIR